MAGVKWLHLIEGGPHASRQPPTSSRSRRLAALTFGALPAGAHPEATRRARAIDEERQASLKMGTGRIPRCPGDRSRRSPATASMPTWSPTRVTRSWAVGALVGRVARRSGSARSTSAIRQTPSKCPRSPDGVSEPETLGSWTEKVIVQRVGNRHFRGDLAAVSFQRCSGTGHRGFGLYDVSDRRTRSAWLSSRRHRTARTRSGSKPGATRAYVYTAFINAERLTSPDGITPGPEKDFQIWDASDPRNPVRVGQWGAWLTRSSLVAPAHLRHLRQITALHLLAMTLTAMPARLGRRHR